MTLDAVSGADKVAADGGWHAAQAVHFWMLAQRQLYAGDTAAAMRTALNLRQ